MKGIQRVRLTDTELMVAAYVGSARNVQAMRRGWEPLADQDPSTLWSSNIEGVCGEIAVAKLLNIYWEPTCGDPTANDVGPYQVRTNMSRKYTDMTLRQRDRPKADRYFISVLSFTPEYEVLGFILGADGFDPKCHRLGGTPGRAKCLYVPQSALRDMSELPPVSELTTPLAVGRNG